MSGKQSVFGTKASSGNTPPNEEPGTSTNSQSLKNSIGFTDSQSALEISDELSTSDSESETEKEQEPRGVAPTPGHKHYRSDQEELEALRLQVQTLEDEKAALLAYTNRCEKELQQYQSQFPDIAAQLVQQQGLRSGNVSSVAGAQSATLGALNPLLIAYEKRLREANAQTRTAEAALASLKKEVNVLRDQASTAVDELEQVKKLAVASAAATSTSAPPSGSGSAASSPDHRDLLAQIELQKQKLEIFAQSELAAKHALSKLPEREALNRALQDAGRVITTQKTQLTAAEAALARSRAAVASLTRELTEAQQKIGEMETLGARYAELSQQLRQQQQAFSNAEKRLLESEAAAEAALAREGALRNELEDSQKDMQGMVTALESVDNQLRAAKQREEDLIALEAKQAQKVVELQEQCDALTVKLERAENESNQLRAQMTNVTNELKEGCVKDVTHVYNQSKAIEEKMRSDVSRLEECVLAAQIENEQLRRRLTMVEEHAAKLSAVCEEELVRVVDELNKTQSALQVEATERGVEQGRVGRLLQQVEAMERMLVNVKETGATYTRDLKAQISALTVSLEASETRLAQSELCSAEREQRLAAELARTEAHADSLSEELQRERKVRVLSEEDLKQRLAEAFEAHDSNSKKAADIILKQEAMAKRWREQQKTALRRLQSLLNDALSKHESDAMKIAALEKVSDALVQERDSLATLLTTEEERCASLALENTDMNRRMSESVRQLNLARSAQERTQQEHSEMMLARDKLMAQNRRLSREIQSLQQQLEHLNPDHRNSAENQSFLLDCPNL